MTNKQKLIFGVIAAILLVGLMGVFVLFQPTGIALNVSNNSSEQGASSQGSGSQGSGSQSGSQGIGNSEGNSGSPGTKYVDCPTCTDGTVTEKRLTTCSYCGGTGLDPKSLVGSGVKCSNCGGAKVTPPLKEYKVTCPTCNGAKQVPA